MLTKSLELKPEFIIILTRGTVKIRTNPAPKIVSVESFIAEPGDVYILDVSKVHSVIPLDNTEINRKAICFSTNSLSFNQVEMMFT